MHSQVSILKTGDNQFCLAIDGNTVGNFPSFNDALKELFMISDYSPPSFSLSSFLLYSSLKQDFEELEECLDKVDLLYKKTAIENQLLLKENEKLKKSMGINSTK